MKWSAYVKILSWRRLSFFWVALICFFFFKLNNIIIDASDFAFDDNGFELPAISECRFLIDLYSNISAEKFREYMLKVGELATDVGTVIYGKEAVDIGLIDRVGTLNDALSFLHTEIEKNKNEKSTWKKYAMVI